MTKHLLLFFVFAISGAAAADEPSIVDARRLLLVGKYTEAEEAFVALAEKQPIEAALGVASCRQACGKRDEADAGLRVAETKHPQAAALKAELALLALDGGNYTTASGFADLAWSREPTCVPARWVRAELHRVAGRLREAEGGYKWLVDYYNATDEIRDPETLHYIGKAAAQYARWNGLSDQFKFLVNDLYPEILEIEKNYWPAHLEAGLLFLEKYNEADAARELKKAEAINPNAAEVHAALAELALQNYDLPEAQRRIDRALEINPQLLRALQLQAKLHLANFDPDKAIEKLAAAIKLNHVSEGTLGLLVAAYIGKEGWPENDRMAEAIKGVIPKALSPSTGGDGRGEGDGRPKEVRPAPPTPLRLQAEARKIIASLRTRNPRAGNFYEALGDGLDLLRHYPTAAEFYAIAVQRMPQLGATRGKLGMMHMRLGNEAEAARVLKKAFEIDPFNVRVSNTLKVLEVLADYAVIETDHFIIKFDRGQDEILATYAARYLEDEVYPALCKKLGYEPQGKSLFEIFSKAKNTSGHGWFSARMVGLPFVGTVGACAGRMVAMQSPNDAKQKFNWARVLRHEFVHVVNLQQTGFNIPHWFTEALAVHNEGFPRPIEWNVLLKERAEAKKLFNLETINTGFIRPKSSGEWNLAYCQAELYAEYMLARFGDDALAKMLAAYADRLATPEAIERSFGVSVEDFERGYSEHVAKVVAKPLSDDARELKTLARIHLKAGDDEKLYPVLEQLADRDFDNATIRKKLAELATARKDHAAAERWSREVLQIDVLDANIHHTLAEALVAQQRPADAIEEYELAVRLAPEENDWRFALAKAHVEVKQNDKAREAIEELLKREPVFPGAAELLESLHP